MKVVLKMSELKTGDTAWWFYTGFDLSWTGIPDILDMEGLGLRCGEITNINERDDEVYFAFISTGFLVGVPRRHIYASKGEAIDAMIQRLVELKQNEVSDE